MVVEISDVGRCVMHRFHLENRFPSLTFHFLKDYELYPDKVIVKVLRVERRHKQTFVTEEVVDPETFPNDLFLTKCMLIA